MRLLSAILLVLDVIGAFIAGYSALYENSFPWLVLFSGHAVLIPILGLLLQTLTEMKDD